MCARGKPPGSFAAGSIQSFIVVWQVFAQLNSSDIAVCENHKAQESLL
jgi:hypothetical protein